MVAGLEHSVVSGIHGAVCPGPCSSSSWNPSSYRSPSPAYCRFNP